MKFLSLVLSFTLVAFVKTSPADTEIEARPYPVLSECAHRQILERTFIGANKDVSAESYSCASSPTARSLTPPFERRDKGANNQCGAPCTTICYTPSGGGPDPNECQVIADALLYESQHTGNFFTIGPDDGSVNYVTLNYSSCNTTFVNKDKSIMTYCRNDWAGVTGYVAHHCQAPQNAHGGICVAKSKEFFIQINHS